MLCSFKKGTDIPDKSYINIKQAWVDFYLKDKETIPYIHINDFELVEEKKETQVIEVQSITTDELDDTQFPLPF